MAHIKTKVSLSDQKSHHVQKYLNNIKNTFQFTYELAERHPITFHRVGWDELLIFSLVVTALELKTNSRLLMFKVSRLNKSRACTMESSMVRY